MSEFSAFTPLAGGTLDTYQRGDEYPYDYDASLDFVRLTNSFSNYPHPSTIGYVDGLVPLFDGMQYALMLGKTPYGDLHGVKTPLPVIFPDLSGGMLKVGT